jgi:hypothetical protein
MMMTKSREYVLDILYRQLKELAVDERVELAPERAAETTLESLRLDSLETLQLARQGQEVPTVPLLRTLGIEFWLQQLTHPNWIRVIADAQHDSALTRISEHLAAKEKMESKRSQVRTAS